MPFTVSVLPAPIVRLPVLLKSPVVEKLAPLVRTELPLLDARPLRAAMVAPCPSRVMFAWLVVMLVPLGKASVEPSRAFQVPPVRVSPESWPNDVGIESERAGFGFDRARVDQRAVDGKRRCPGPAGLLDRAGVVDDVAAIEVVHAGVRLDQVQATGLDHQSGRRTLSLCRPKSPVPVWMIVP